MAQNDTALSAAIPADDYIYKLDTLITLKLSINNENDKFKIQGDDFLYNLSPNVNYFTRINFNYKFLSFRYDFILRPIPGNGDNEEKGKTRVFAIDLNIYLKHWSQDLQYSKVNGYYLENTSDFVPGWTEGEDPYITLPDLNVKIFRGATSYKFNPLFSLKAIRNQTEIQAKSAGSFITELSYNYFIIDNKSTSSAQQSSQRSDNFDVILSAGYMYNFIYKKRWYLNCGAGVGYGMNFTKLTTRYPDENLITHSSAPEFRFKEEVELGYNSKRFFTGMELFLAQTSRKENDASVSYNFSRTILQFFVGYRFNAPGIIKKTVNSVEDNFSDKEQKNKDAEIK